MTVYMTVELRRPSEEAPTEDRMEASIEVHALCGVEGPPSSSPLDDAAAEISLLGVDGSRGGVAGANISAGCWASAAAVRRVVCGAGVALMRTVGVA